MRSLLKIMLSFALYIILAFCLSSCKTVKSYEEGYNEGFEDGHFYATEELTGHSFEMYQNGYDEAYRDFVFDIIQSEAIDYARNFGGYGPEEAMCIIDSYKRGDSYWGKTPITEAEYIDAVETLYHYYEYFFIAMYEDDTYCDFDFYYEHYFD